jgi:hypothetical protein
LFVLRKTSFPFLPIAKISTCFPAYVSATAFACLITFVLNAPHKPLFEVIATISTLFTISCINWIQHDGSPALNYVFYGKHKNQFKPKSKNQELLGRIMVLSDSAHSFGANYKGKKCGALADVSVFSFHAVKNLTTAEGGAVALKDISRSIDSINKGYSILKKSLMSPMTKILTNAGMSEEDAKKHLMLNDGAGVNVVSMSIADMMDMGIIDPTKVTKEAVRNAVSVATTLLSTDTVITNIRA